MSSITIGVRASSSDAIYQKASGNSEAFFVYALFKHERCFFCIERRFISINKPVEYVTLPEDWKTVYSDLDDYHKRAFWNTIFKKIIVSGNGKEKKYKVEWQ